MSFTAAAREVLAMAEAEARLTHVDVWPEHLVSALLRVQAPDTVEILSSLEIDDKRLRSRLAERAANDTRPAGEVRRHSDAVRHLLDCAKREAEAQRFSGVEPRHILLALVKQDEGLLRSLMPIAPARSSSRPRRRVRFRSVASLPHFDPGLEDAIERTRRAKKRRSRRGSSNARRTCVTRSGA